MDYITRLINAEIDRKLTLIFRDPAKVTVFDSAGPTPRYRNPANALDAGAHALIDHEGLPGVPLLSVLRQAYANAATIVVAHNFGRRPAVQVLGGAGAELYGRGLYGMGDYSGSADRQVIEPLLINHDSINQVTVTLNEVDSGEVICIG
ncbi:hypothetical protein ACOBQJ_13160 [Pelotomaculum propionicicum]|uniref:hypothetical protein n=1 Tax=Pelotomaculum propionicicum TaxID=258475 RepID=UPI003B7CE0B1